MDTIALDTTTWDLTTGAISSPSPSPLSPGLYNIQLNTGATAQAQDAASAIKTFKGEVYYDTTLGIPYFARILGYLPPLTYVKAQLVSAALTVPGVTAAVAYLSSFVNRVLSGQVQITTDTEDTAAANF